MKIFITSFAFLCFACSVALADCNIDCNAKCCQTVRITPWDKNRVCEPTCKASCEASKAACNVTGGAIPAFNTPNLIAKITQLLQTSCAAAFEVINDAVLINQGSYAAGSDFLLNQAKDVLIRTGLFPASEFNNVSIRWANLRGDGQAPDRNIVLISESFLSQPPLQALYSTASTLGHEMVHIGQYRRMGTDNFKCQYSRIYAGCGCQDLGGGRLRCGCQDNRNPLEAEAYSWNVRNNPTIAQAIGFHLPGAYPPPPQMMQNRMCATAMMSCPMPTNALVGTQCYCPGPSGWMAGIVQ